MGGYPVTGGRYPGPCSDTADADALPEILLVSVYVDGKEQIGRVAAGRSEAAIEHLRDMWHALVRADNLFGNGVSWTLFRRTLGRRSDSHRLSSATNVRSPLR
jgi:hypothetical protein